MSKQSVSRCTHERVSLDDDRLHQITITKLYRSITKCELSIVATYDTIGILHDGEIGQEIRDRKYFVRFIGNPGRHPARPRLKVCVVTCSAPYPYTIHLLVQITRSFVFADALLFHDVDFPEVSLLHKAVACISLTFMA